MHDMYIAEIYGRGAIFLPLIVCVSTFIYFYTVRHNYRTS